MAKPADQVRIEDAAEHMLRKVHPSQIKEGRPSKTTFLPRATDMRRLSVDRSSIITASDCYVAYAAAKQLHHINGGIWAVTVAECRAQGLPCLSDPLAAEESGGPNPAHALIDMHELDEEAMHSAATHLYVLAKARGKLAPA